MSNLSFGGCYIYEHPDCNNQDIYKIGKSNDIIRRYKTLSTSYFTQITKSLYIYPTDDKLYTSGYLIFLEKLMHKKFIDKRINLNREFFKLDKVKEELEKFKLYIQQLGINIELTDDIKILGNVHDKFLIDYEKEEATDYGPLIIEQSEFQPYDYQIDIINKINEVLDIKKRGILELATGIGKTYISAFYIKQYNIKSVLVLCPQILICESFKNALTKCNLNSNIINSENQGEFNSNKKSKKRSIDITTYQTYLLNTELIDKLNYDLIIYDEAHHLLSDEFRKSLFAKSDKKLFMTATKKTYKSLEVIDQPTKSFIDETNNINCDDDEASSEATSNEASSSESSENCSNQTETDEYFDMDDPIFGETIYKITVEDAITRGLLCDYKIFLGNWNDGILSLLIELKEKYLRKKIIMYFNSVENSKNICNMIIDFKAFHIDGSMSKNTKKEILENFKSEEFSILCNVSIISEGVDIPEIDTVIFMENRYSDIMITQNIGRSLRKTLNKDFSMVIMREKMFNSKEFLFNLSKQDKRVGAIGMYIKPANSINYDLTGLIKLYEIEKAGGLFKWWMLKCLEYENENPEIFITRKSKYCNFNIGVWLDGQYSNFRDSKLTLDKINQLKLLRTFNKWLNKKKKDKVIILPFNDIINVIIEKESKNEELEDSLCSISNINLYRWIISRKQDYKKDKIKQQDRIDKLKSLKCFNGWLLKGKDKKKQVKRTFTENIKLAIEQENIGEISSDNLINWIKTQKKKFKKGELKQDEINELNKIKYFKDWITSGDSNKKLIKSSIDEIITLCVEFENENPNVVITQKTKYKGKNIGASLTTITQRYMSKDKIIKSTRELKTLTETEINNLQNIKWFANWQTNYDYLKKHNRRKEFTEIVDKSIIYENEHKKFSESAKYNDEKIGNNISNYKQDFIDGKLTKGEEEYLLKFNYWKEYLPSLKEKRTLKKARTLKEFDVEYNNLDLTKNDASMARFLRKQKKKFDNDTLTEYEKEKLNNISFWRKSVA